MALTKISTDGVKDDAITKAKIPADQIEASELANNAVDTNAIQDQAVTLDKLPHGDSNNDGKFLRANNGADPSFETVSIPAGTTINNNADNRVITGSGTANTLNGESLVTIDSNGRLSVEPNAGGSGITLASAGSTFGGIVKLRNTAGSNHDWIIGVGGGDGAYVAGRGLLIRDETTGANRIAIDTSGKVGIGISSPTVNAQIQSSGTNSLLKLAGTSAGSGINDGLDVGINGVDGILWNRENGPIQFATNNSERMRILAGGGLTFNGDTADANALNDYEEGSFDIVAGSGSSTSFNSSNNKGSYTKIGRQVTIAGQLRISSGSGNVRIALPFNSAANTNDEDMSFAASVIGYDYNAQNGSDCDGLFILIDANSSYARFMEHIDNNPWTSLDGDTGAYLRFTITYFVA